MSVQATKPVPTPSGPEQNLALWGRLSRTDPRATKPFKRAGGFSGTQIDPTWRLKMMTEAFGPVGQGWGYEQLEWTVQADCIFVCCRVWYRDAETGEQRWTGPQWGGTELMRRRREGNPEPNDEAFKMSITDAIGKCCVQIGLAADVHMGQFDDSKYRDESAAYYEAKEKPELQPAAIGKFDEEMQRKTAECADVHALDALWKSGVSKRLVEIGKVDRKAMERIVAYFSQRKADLLAPPEKPKEPPPPRKPPPRGRVTTAATSFDLADANGVILMTVESAHTWCLELEKLLAEKNADAAGIWKANQETVNDIRSNYNVMWRIGSRQVSAIAELERRVEERRQAAA
jgi:hypothetical protein